MVEGGATGWGFDFRQRRLTPTGADLHRKTSVKIIKCSSRGFCL
ncbi:hypothetical protein Hanom_Chr14g01248371 [Helianthus anomalus]